MKLATKLPLAFASVLLLMLAAAAYGIYSLNGSLDTYGTTVQASNDHERAVGDLNASFKVQVQEWKNTLLRGKSPKDLDKHWAAFAKRENEVKAGVQKLLAVLLEGESKSLLDKFAQAHTRMGESYRKGFDAFKTAGFEASAGDTAVHGMDREPVKLLDQAGARIAADSAVISAAAAANGKRATLVSGVVMLLTCMAGIAIGAGLSRGVIKRLGGEPEAAAELARRVAAGDLSAHIDIRQGDTASLMVHLKQMQASLAAVVSHVRQSAESVATASAQIAQAGNDLSGRTEEQASALEQTAASMEELGSAVRQNADNVGQASRLALTASGVAINGGKVVGRVVDTMKGINDSSKKIADIIGVIDSIAFQTNILALNAAVEAARAGEQGRGFAVVASEVRSLAGRSAEAAKEIRGLIHASVERVEQGSALVDEAGVTMTEVVASIKQVTDIMGEISSAITEQSTGAAQVSEAVNQMDQATQQNAALVEESAAAAESLKVQAEQLVRAVAVFKLSPGMHGADSVLVREGVERRGSGRANNVARPNFTARTSPDPVPRVRDGGSVARKTGTDDEWSSF